ETSMPAGDYASFAQPPDPAGFAGDSKEARELIEKRFGVQMLAVRTLERYTLNQSKGTGLLIPVPTGWRGFDDGKAARLINPVKRIAVTLTVAPLEGFANWDEAREYVWKMARQQADKRAQSDPRYQARLIRLANGVFGVRETNIQDNDGAYSSAVLYEPHPGDAKRAVRINLYCPVE